MANEKLPEMVLACRKPLETMCHTINLNKPFKSYKQEIYGGHLVFSHFVHSLQNICMVVHPANLLQHAMSLKPFWLPGY